MYQHLNTNVIPSEEEQLIDAEFNDLLEGYLNSHHRKKVEKIVRAYRFAKKAHAGIRRRSGEPYILHPIAVAKIVNREIGLGSTSICAALLHDVVEDTDYTVEDIRHQFGDKIARIVEGLTKISGGIFGDRASAQAENFRKLLLTMSDDIRVVLIKMADRLHNMRTLGSMPPEKQYKIAGETLYIYAPLAHRLGLFAIKSELEDLSFKYEHPDDYDTISALIAESEKQRNERFDNFIAPIRQRLDERGIVYEAKARVKSIYSIWRKMKTKNIPFSEVYDLYAARIIFQCDNIPQEKERCWEIYSVITDLYKMHPDRLRDWVVNPKANGYQALHVTVMGQDGNWVEVQIRSQRMDEKAEKGFAAHWHYKVGDGDEESELNVWLQTIKDLLTEQTADALDFLDTLKLNLFASEIIVFTPKGELVTLPNGSTVLDLAFHLHSQIGLKAIAGKVNHKLVPLNHQLQSGDQVEILTSNNQHPRSEWLQYLTSAKALSRLRAALRRERQPLLDKGKQILDEFLADGQVEPTNNVITKITGFYKLPSPAELYYRLGTGDITLNNYILKDSPKTSPGLLAKILRIGRKGKSKNAATPQQQISPDNVDLKKTYTLTNTPSQCNYIACPICSPLPGDKVIAFLNLDNDVEIHLHECERAQLLKSTLGNRIIPSAWGETGHPVQTEVIATGIATSSTLLDINKAITSLPNVSLSSLNYQTNAELFSCTFSILLPDAKTLSTLLSALTSVKGIHKAFRQSPMQTKNRLDNE